MNEKTLNENKMQEEEAERKKKTKKYVELAKWQAASNCKWSILQAAVVVVVLLYLRLLLLIPLLFLSFSNRSRERAKVAAHTGITVEHTHTLADTHMVSLTRMHTCRLCSYAAHTGITVQCSAALTHWQTETHSHSLAHTHAHLRTS